MTASYTGPFRGHRTHGPTGRPFQDLRPYGVHAFGVDWSVHIPKLVAFWSRELLGEPGYTGRPVGAHLPVLDRRRFGDGEIGRWLELWNETVDELFVGPVAEAAKERAALAGQAIATVARRHAQGRRHLSLGA
jgi:truncated hemoglobin YjbI